MSRSRVLGMSQPGAHLCLNQSHTGRMCQFWWFFLAVNLHLPTLFPGGASEPLPMMTLINGLS